MTPCGPFLSSVTSFGEGSREAGGLAGTATDYRVGNGRDGE